MKRFIATEEQAEFIKNNVKGLGNAELAKLFNEKFGTDVTMVQIRTFKKNHNLKSGLDGRFKKGHTPFNKGKKGEFKGSKETWFKKGHKPVNYKPIGSERVNVDGYIEIKVADPNKWRLKQRVVWEEHHGEIPNGYLVLFLDRNKQNLDINNLILVSKKQLAFLNKNKLIKEDKELTKTGLIIADLLIKISDAEKEGEKKKCIKRKK
ncbi:HNH endonuclease signature motif containing protein [Clostridium perfringens]